MHPNATETERITRLEEGQYSLQETVQKLAELQTDQAEMQAREHSQTRKEIVSLANKFSEHGKPNFSVIIAACSFLFVLGGAVLSPLYFQIQENKDRVRSMEIDFHAHENLSSHPVASAVMEEREKAAKAEAALREMLELQRHELLENKIDKLHKLP